ncbi:carbamoyl-phosphate synthase, large subunit [Pirellula staleyi DSM 6068]|uniref:Carbamoyl phosphate synthase large chain n=1 Tax=Pirellula staleyi (strain ATCC 27377 / DSM 6068 / ICPB 4128) TaxID=530564 RepID=D2QXL5_PIRSD|nr:carbamoyl-phosphate synthase large subunit [Pirellula staleyi]ADB16200.1 carbamoyl-phosphate synthase, large subunit [Pirellula staleyi DSM 6068]
MPRRNDIKKILLIGSGPIVIGQACEFDYSGTQACKALREEGYVVVLVNSNPATIMTDPEMADRTYIEPLTWEVVSKVIEKERPDAILPTLGGQTGLNLAMDLAKHGVLEKYGVEMIGANAKVIAKAEEREQFKQAMEKIGLECCRGETIKTVEDARRVLQMVGLPCVVRPSFTLGGSGSAIAYNQGEFDMLVRRGLDQSPVREVLIEESIIGWKEYEMEVMRDMDDNVVIICSIENFDPMGVHTGDSITVAPAQTLSDKEYQRMRDASLAVIREIGVETGGSNIQFAIHPQTGRMIVIEMNPRVSRSSALASKATGFPIAKIAAKLAVGYRLHELSNDITRKTKACFEPTIDYVVTKIPRFAFEKFPEADPTLMTQMKSVGETMAIGRTFKESFQKALRGLEVGAFGFGCDSKDKWGTTEQPSEDDIRAKLSVPNAERVWHLRYALKSGMSVETIHDLTKIDRWFLDHLEQLVQTEEELRRIGDLNLVDTATFRKAKQQGFSDRQLATLWDSNEIDVRAARKARGIIPTYKSVDTCAAEFEAYTPYYYSTYEDEDEVPPKQPGKQRIMILGGGPNRIGQGIEFDYCCCHASFALREMGIESIMVNSNPETVSTDYDTSDLLFFEPLTNEDVLNIYDAVQPDGVIVQFGGQTPLNLARALSNAGVPVIGTSVDAIEASEDREQFAQMLSRLGLKQPANGIARNMSQARTEGAKVGFPSLVRPSFVLGGRAMEICYDQAQFERFVAEAFVVAQGQPVLIDRFLEDATEVDVDCISDGENVVIAGIMEHIEEAGVHSGDSACAIPPYSLPGPVIQEIREATHAMARHLKVVGLMNVQFAVKKEEGRPVIYILEVNPRASRTVPFVAKATGLSVAKIAAKVMAGMKLPELGVTREPIPSHVSVKESVFPFRKFVGVDIVLGPEMRSTGEVMGVSERFSIAFAKGQLAAGTVLPTSGKIFVSVSARHKESVVDLARRLHKLGHELVATEGTARRLAEAGIPVEAVKKIAEGRPNLLDYLNDGVIQLVLNTPSGKGARTDEGRIRAAAVQLGVPCITTIQAAEAAVKAMEALREEEITVQSLQDRFPDIKPIDFRKRAEMV